MFLKSVLNKDLWQRTREAFLCTRLLGVPFWAMLNLLPIILYKNLHISPLQITTLIALKPISALLAPYWSQSVYQREDRLVSNLVWANLLRYLPFLFLPWIDSSWLIILAFSFYMILSRGAIPAWMEVFKRNLPDDSSRERVFAYGMALEYLGAGLVPLGLGILLDGYADSWRWIFPMAALLGILSTFYLLRIPRIATPLVERPDELPSLREQFLNPWRQSWQVVREQRDFAHYLIGFMLGGAGLMIMQPALPMFFVDVLNLSYTEMLLALAVCKGVGYAITSPVWVRFFRKLDIFSFSGIVTILAFLFPFLLLGAQYQLSWLYIAYVVYGIMQSGSELSWHMSGPHFAKDKDSSVYSSTNILLVGLRGCIIPVLGGILCAATSSTEVILIGALLCFSATCYLMGFARRATLLQKV